MPPQVYNPTADKLSPRTVFHERGIAYLRCVMSDEVYNVITSVGDRRWTRRRGDCVHPVCCMVAAPGLTV